MTDRLPDAGQAPRLLRTVLHFAVSQRWFVVTATAAIAALGTVSFLRLPIDAVPDITNVQVQVNTVAEGLPPTLVEKLITQPIEASLSGVPASVQIRSLSRYGLSQVTVVFRDGTDIYFARQLVNERLQEARENLPPGDFEPTLGPIATGLGEIFSWTVESLPGARKPGGAEYTPTDLRELQDWVIKPQIRTVPGVAEVNTIGGFRKQYHVTPYPGRLRGYALAMQDVVEAIEANNADVGAGYVERKGEQVLVRATGRLATTEQIGDVVVTTRDGLPIRVRDVASVGLGKELRTGAATLNGSETVLGTAIMLLGENSRTVARQVAAKLEEVGRTLPPGVVARPVYNRTSLVDATLKTVSHNLLEGAALVIAVLFLLLGNITSALVVALVIPLSMLFTFTGMAHGRISANLLSLGAIDFGIIVDGAVVMAENVLHRVTARQRELGRALSAHERHHEVFAGAVEIAQPTIVGVGIIMIVYLPILSLSGIEGKMFRPMAQVVLLALTGALLFAFTLVPAALSFLLRGRLPERGSPLERVAARGHEPVLRWTLRHRVPVVLAGASVVAIALALVPRLGSEFVTTLDEGDMAAETTRIPGTSLGEGLAMQAELEHAAIQAPEVSRAYSILGTAEIANDPVPPGNGDLFLITKPRREWPDPKKSKSELVRELEGRLDPLPGNILEFTQPIQMRFNELIAGVRSDVGVKVFGDDLGTLREIGGAVARTLGDVPGLSGIRIEQTAGLPMLTIDVDRGACARYGVKVSELQGLVSTAIGGSVAGQVFEGDRRFSIVVRLPEELRSDLRGIEELPVRVQPPEARTGRDGGGPADGPEYVPLDLLAHLRLEEGPNQISRENGKRRLVVQANVRGRDLGGAVADAERRIAQAVTLPAGYWISWGGQYENLEAARRRLALIVPVALLLVFVFLALGNRSIKDALLVFSGVPFSLTGGVLALALRHLPFSVTAGVGFITLSGVAVLNGLLTIASIRRGRDEGRPLDEAIREGTIARFRQILTVSLVAALGFIPMAISTGTGAEVQRPLATVVIGGILSSTILTMFVFPALYRLAHRDREVPEEI